MTPDGSDKDKPVWPSAVPLTVGLIGAGLFLATLLIWNTLFSVPGNLVRPAKVHPLTAKIVVRAENPGRVRSIRVQTGQMVKKGEVLIDLDRSGLDLRLARIEQDIRELSAAGGQSLTTEDGETDLIGKQTALINEQIKGLSNQRRAVQAKLTLLDQAGNAIEQGDPDSEWRRAGMAAEIDEIDARIAVLRARAAENDLLLARLGRRASGEQDSSANQFAAAIFELEAIADQIRAQMANNEISAPADGVVRVLGNLDKGAAIQAGEPLLKIFPLNGTGTADFGVETNQAKLVRVGQAVRIKMNGTDKTAGPEFRGTIASLTPQAGGYRVRAEFNAGLEILETPSAAIASVEIGEQSPTELLVAPVTALIADAVNR